METAVKKILKETKVSELLGEDAGDFRIVKPPFTVDSRDEVADVMMKFAKHHFHAAPVWDSENLKFIGFIAVVDLVLYMLRLTQTMDENEDAATLTRLAEEYATKPVKELVDASRAAPFISASPKSSILDVLEIFASGYQQIAVMENQETPSEMLGVVTQMTVVKWFSNLLQSKSVSELGDNVFKPVTELGNLGLGDVATVDEDAPVRKAFESLALFRITGVAVVNKDRQLVDTLSAFDLNGLLIESIGNVMKPVKEYLHPLSELRPVAPVSFTKDRPLSAIIGRLAEMGLHRAWIVDESNIPVGVVTLTDICDALLRRL